MKVDVAVLGSPSLISRMPGFCERNATSKLCGTVLHKFLSRTVCVWFTRHQVVVQSMHTINSVQTNRTENQKTFVFDFTLLFFNVNYQSNSLTFG